MDSPTHRADLFHGPDEDDISSRLNWLRAGVLGVNDGIVSIAALLVGVAAATTDAKVIATAAFAGISAGALSMGVGEYVSVSSQRDAEEAQLAREAIWQKARPAWELEQLVRLNMETGMSEETARTAAREQHDHDPLTIHAKMHLGIDPDDLTNPWAAGIASFLAFTLGGMAPLLTMLLAGPTLRIPLTFITVVVALAVVGALSARIAHSPYIRSIIRNSIGGAVAMAVTYGIGSAFGTVV